MFYYFSAPPESFISAYSTGSRVRFSENDLDLGDSDSEPRENNMLKSEQGSQESFENGRDRGIVASTSTLDTLHPYSDSTVSLNVDRAEMDREVAGKPRTAEHLKPDAVAGKPPARAPSPNRPKRISVSPAPKRRQLAGK